MKIILSLSAAFSIYPFFVLGAEDFDYEETLADIRAERPEVEIDEEMLAEAMKNATPEQLASLLGDDLEALKVGAATELGRRGHPAVCLFLRAGSHRVRAAAGRGILDDPVVEEGLLPLAQTLAWIPSDRLCSEVAIAANTRLGGAAEAERLFAYATDQRTPSEFRTTALKRLRYFKELSPELIASMDQRLGKFLLSPKSSFTGDFLTEALVLSKRIEHPITDIELTSIFYHNGLDAHTRGVALLELMNNGADWEKLIQGAQEPDVWFTVLENWYRDNPDATLASIRRDFGFDFPFSQSLGIGSLPMAQKTLLFLASLETDSADSLLEEIINEPQGSIALHPELWLEIEEVLALRGDAFSEDTHRNFAKLTAPSKKGPHPEDAFPELLMGGDMNEGLLVLVSQKAGCLNCHSHWASTEDFDDTGEIILPFFSRSSKDNLRAIIAPNHDLRNGYGYMVVELTNGTFHKGTPTLQTADSLEILLEGTTQKLKIERNDIAKITSISPMPSVLGTLSKREIRDLVAYLSEG
ncbi:hypothetical protein AAFN60_10740 [Roseibacillus persicicus]|uniref:hypothetical protein n=1 Tax=Roseibacillus persicicus TaxID=454148 RepID=UPI00398B0354